MSAETILQSVLLEIGLEKTGPQIGSNDFDIAQIREYLNQAGEDISKRAEWQGLYKTETVAGGVSSHDLPADFQEMGERGAVYLNKAGFAPVRVVIDPTSWAFISRRSSAQPYCHLSGGKLHFTPALDADGAAFTYVSKNWVVSGASVVSQNADTFHIPERLLKSGILWRWFRDKGMPFEDHLNEFEADLVQEIKANRGQA
jgi:hypothetical protein